MAKYSNMPICDLRTLNIPEAIRQIEEIHDIAMLILPSDSSDEVMSALAAIPKNNIANILYLPKNEKISMINGVGTLNAAPGAEQYVIVNGIGLVRHLAKDAKITLNVNGFCLIDETLKEHSGINMSNINGEVVYCDLSVEPKIYLNKISFDAATIQYLKKGQTIIVGNKLTLESDISIEMLAEKELVIIVGNKLICPKHLAGYLTATATIGNKLEIME